MQESNPRYRQRNSFIKDQMEADLDGEQRGVVRIQAIGTVFVLLLVYSAGIALLLMFRA